MPQSQRSLIFTAFRGSRYLFNTHHPTAHAMPLCAPHRGCTGRPFISDGLSIQITYSRWYRPSSLRFDRVAPGSLTEDWEMVSTVPERPYPDVRLMPWPRHAPRLRVA
ncbi:hypothetical protein LshimejAT787_1900070 [Lyophyllum shimeji]|uniref:Uncharacterized protein n=1 Tax=Lyophyllum shimeji TaxID=47721 RepID=A0A9P3Q0H1_LYOSH|nr:hypothetical protein LshimejAT787_1900070 [Lyophyllum shimeji]